MHCGQSNSPSSTSPSSAAVLAKVNTFCTAAPSRTPKTFSTERKIDHQHGHQVLRVQPDVHVAQHHRPDGNRRHMPEMHDPVCSGYRREEHAQELAECHADCGNRAGLDDQVQRPAVEKSPQRPQRLAQVHVLPARVRHHRRQFAVGQRAGDGQEAGHQPRRNQQRRRVDLARNLGRDNKDARADHRAHHQRGCAGQAQSFYKFVFAAGEGNSLRFGAQ